MKYLQTFLAGCLFAGCVAAGVANLRDPYCPTEDSCRPQYSDGRWTIEEVTP